MKTTRLFAAGLIILIATFSNVNAQTKGNGNVTTQDRQVSSFNAIKVGGAINLILKQGNQQLVSVQTDENLQSHIIVKVEGGTLNLSCEKIQNPTKLDVYVTAVNLKEIDASGAAKVTGETKFRSEAFSLKTSGAAQVVLDIETGSFDNETTGAASNKLTLASKTAKTEISGAGSVVLKGTVEKHITEVSGAAHLKAGEFVSDYTEASVSGAGSAEVMARKKLKTDISGAGSISYWDKGKVQTIDQHDQSQITF
jgi:hypothetical protein